MLYEVITQGRDAPVQTSFSDLLRNGPRPHQRFHFVDPAGGRAREEPRPRLSDENVVLDPDADVPPLGIRNNFV